MPWRSPKRGDLRAGGRRRQEIAVVIGESPRNGRGSPRGAIAERRGEGASESCGAPEDRGVVLGEHVVVDAWARAVGRRAADRAAGDGARRRARADRVTLEVRARDELALQVVRPDLAGLPHRDLAGARRRTRSGANEGSGGEQQTEHRKLDVDLRPSHSREARGGALGTHVTCAPLSLRHPAVHRKLVALLGRLLGRHAAPEPLRPALGRLAAVDRAAEPDCEPRDQGGPAPGRAQVLRDGANEREQYGV